MSAHGNAHAARAIRLEHLDIKAAAFPPEHKVALVGVCDIGEAALSGSREQMELVFAMRFEKRIRARPSHDLDIVPIVASRALEVALGRSEAHRLDKVQPRADARARARDVSGVLRNLRFNQHDVEHANNPFANP